MKELGAYLKRTRVSNGVNIAEAAEDLDLSVPELENIESGNVKAFKDNTTSPLPNSSIKLIVSTVLLIHK